LSVENGTMQGSPVCQKQAAKHIKCWWYVTTFNLAQPWVLQE